MKLRHSPPRSPAGLCPCAILICCGSIIIALGQTVMLAQEAPPSAPPAAQSQVATTTTSDLNVPKLPPDQLDSLVAPIALYSDNLLAQTLAASTYPLEIIQLQQWMAKNKNLKDKALMEAV